MSGFADLIGVPWLEGGRDKAEGFDCYGVVLEGLERLGWPMLDVWECWRDEYRDGWRDYVEAVPPGWVWLEQADEVIEGDVLVSRDQGMPRHLSLAVRVDKQLRALTAIEPHGVVLLPLATMRDALEGVVRREDAA